MSELLIPCPSKTCGLRKAPCDGFGKIIDPDDLPCSGLSSDLQELKKGYDRSSEGPSVKPKNEEGDLSAEELAAIEYTNKEYVDNRVNEKGERVTKGVPPCEDGRGRPVDRFGRLKR